MLSIKIYSYANSPNFLNKESNEDICIFTNTNYFITGESLYFQIQNRNSFSKIIYVEVINNSLQKVNHQKLYLENGLSKGTMFIGSDFKTGVYKIISYTLQSLKQKKKQISSKDIFIVNPQDDLNYTFFIDNEFQNLKNETLIKENPLKINKTNFKKRESIRIDINEIKKMYKDSIFTIKVKPKSIIDEYTKSLITPYKEDITINIKSNNIISEIRGEVISGYLIPKKTNTSLKNIPLSLSILGKNNSFKITSTDEKGNFTFIIDEKIYSKNTIIQCINDNKEDYIIKIDDPITIDYSNFKFTTPLRVYKNFLPEIKQRYISAQIDLIYKDFKKDTIIDTDTSLNKFYSPNYETYQLNEFTQFETIKEIIIEIIDGLYISKESSRTKIKIRDYNNIETISDALVIVDDQFVDNIDELLKNKSEVYEKVDIVRGGYVYGGQVFNGIVSFKTKDNIFESKVNGSYIVNPKIERPIEDRILFFPNYEKNSFERIPDYRSNLYWSTSDEIINNTIKFFTSDNTGFYTIEIEGIDKNNNHLLIEQSFEVKE